jgi:hypothetical protein
VPPHWLGGYAAARDEIDDAASVATHRESSDAAERRDAEQFAHVVRVFRTLSRRRVFRDEVQKRAFTRISR